MPRKIRSQPSHWPRRFMFLTGFIIFVVAIIAFSAMNRNDFALAFPLFISIVVLLGFEVVLMFLHNRA